MAVTVATPAPKSLAALTGFAPDPRLGEAIDHVRSRRLADGPWPLDWSPAGRVWFDVDDGQGAPSRWVTLRALRVLKWWEKDGQRNKRTRDDVNSGLPKDRV